MHKSSHITQISNPQCILFNLRFFKNRANSIKHQKLDHKNNIVGSIYEARCYQIERAPFLRMRDIYFFETTHHTTVYNALSNDFYKIMHVRNDCSEKKYVFMRKTLDMFCLKFILAEQLFVNTKNHTIKLLETMEILEYHLLTDFVEESSYHELEPNKRPTYETKMKLLQAKLVTCNKLIEIIFKEYIDIYRIPFEKNILEGNTKFAKDFKNLLKTITYKNQFELWSLFTCKIINQQLDSEQSDYYYKHSSWYQIKDEINLLLHFFLIPTILDESKNSRSSHYQFINFPDGEIKDVFLDQLIKGNTNLFNLDFIYNFRQHLYIFTILFVIKFYNLLNDEITTHVGGTLQLDNESIIETPQQGHAVIAVSDPNEKQSNLSPDVITSKDPELLPKNPKIIDSNYIQKQEVPQQVTEISELPKLLYVHDARGITLDNINYLLQEEKKEIDNWLEKIKKFNLHEYCYLNELIENDT